MTPLSEGEVSGMKAAVRRLGDLLVVYGHGLLAFGAGSIATGGGNEVAAAGGGIRPSEPCLCLLYFAQIGEGA